MAYRNFCLKPPKGNLIAHRGISSLAPENTLASIVLAAEQQISWIEFDLRLTKDHALILFHDDTLERTTNGQGWVHEHPLSTLKQLDAGSWFSSKYEREKIPTLEEILPLILSYHLFPNIELKLSPKQPFLEKKTLISKLISALNAYWPLHHPLPLVSSFHWELLDMIRHLMPNIPVGFLHDECSEEQIQKVIHFPNSSLHCQYQNLTLPLISKLQRLEIPVLTYTVNEPDMAYWLIEQGVFAIFSDNPAAISRISSKG